jgi:hypothetical protein
MMLGDQVIGQKLAADREGKGYVKQTVTMNVSNLRLPQPKFNPTEAVRLG